MTTIANLSYDDNIKFKDISISSFNSYKRYLKKLDIHNISIFCIHELAEDNILQFIQEKLDNIENINTRALCLFAVNFFYKCYNLRGVDIVNKMLENNRDFLEAKKKMVKNNRIDDKSRYIANGEVLDIEKLKESFLNKWYKLDNIINNSLEIDINICYDKTLSILQRYFLVSLYLFHPPQRNNFLNMFYVKAVDEDKMSLNMNYLIDHGAHIEIVLNVFKTAKIYNQLRFKASQISTIIFFKLRDFYRQGSGYQNYDNVFLNYKSGLYNRTYKLKPYSASSNKVLSEASKFIFNHALSCNDYRHLYVINLHKSKEWLAMTVEEREQSANDMGHKLQTANENYYKV